MSEPSGADEGVVDRDTIDALAEELEAGGLLIGLADTTCHQPPADLRRHVLGAIADRPKRPTEGQPPAELYRLRSESWYRLLIELGEHDWALTGSPYEWTLHELVAHVTVIEAYTARQLGLTSEPALPADDPTAASHLAFGEPERRYLLDAPPAVAIDRWRASNELILGHVRSPQFDPERPVPLHGWPFDAATALTARAFELWTHSEDIQRATGRPLDVLSAGELRTMSSASVTALPLLLPLVSEHPMSPTRVVLTGAGGGVFDLGGGVFDLGDEVGNLLVVDVVDYCRVATRRRSPDTLDATRQGDTDLLDALLRAAQAVAV